MVTKYGKKGAAGQRVLFLDVATKSLAWRDLNCTSPGHRRSISPSFASFLKGQRETLALSHLVEVRVCDGWPARGGGEGLWRTAPSARTREMRHAASSKRANKHSPSKQILTPMYLVTKILQLEQTPMLLQTDELDADI